MTLFDTFVVSLGRTTDGHVPTAYALRCRCLTLSYGKLVRRYPSAGSAAYYAQKSISPDRWLYGGLVFSAQIYDRRR